MSPENQKFLESAVSVAGVCFAIGLWLRRKEMSPRNWSQVPGVITASYTVRKAVGQGRNEILPILEYEFVAACKKFNTSHWRVANFSIGGSDDAAAIVARYCQGASVSVFVNPKDPMNSVLEYGPTLLSWIPIGFGILFSLMTVLAFTTI